MDKDHKKKISESIKPTITEERRNKMSVKMKEFWNHQKRLESALKDKNREIKKLRKQVKKLTIELNRVKYAG